MAQPSTDSEAGTYSKRTPLFDLHREFGGKMVLFAGYEMPVQYSEGILKEHQHTRANAGLFDVSHMGQVELLGEGAAVHLEALVPGGIFGALRKTRHVTPSLPTMVAAFSMTLWSQMPGTACCSSSMRHAERRIFSTSETVCQIALCWLYKGQRRQTL